MPLSPFANRPTKPLLYIDGDFVGGCDIVREMYEAGELQEILAKVAKCSNVSSA